MFNPGHRTGPACPAFVHVHSPDRDEQGSDAIPRCPRPPSSCALPAPPGAVSHRAKALGPHSLRGAMGIAHRARCGKADTARSRCSARCALTCRLAASTSSRAAGSNVQTPVTPVRSLFSLSGAMSPASEEVQSYSLTRCSCTRPWALGRTERAERRAPRLFVIVPVQQCFRFARPAARARPGGAWPPPPRAGRRAGRRAGCRAGHRARAAPPRRS